jgi:heme-degrading monooxygenase HmoA
MEQAFIQAATETESAAIPGVIKVYVYQTDADSREFYMAVVFESRESYVANAQSPEQHQRYLQLRQHLEADPDWHDGNIVFSGPG